MRLSLQSCSAIWRFMCCTLHATRLFSAAAWFWLKIASSGRDALAGTRWAQFNYNDKKARRLAGEGKLREDRRHDKSK
jgi:hypothetical protein